MKIYLPNISLNEENKQRMISKYFKKETEVSFVNDIKEVDKNTVIIVHQIEAMMCKSELKTLPQKVFVMSGNKNKLNKL